MTSKGALTGARIGMPRGVTNANPLAGLANTIADVARHGAGAQANAVSFASQAAQGAFNQASANNANTIGDYRLGDQYGYNSAMWQQAADWNERMFNQSMAFNAEQAELNRAFQERMDSTKYQRAIKDMEAAGLNPIMAVTGGGISVGGGAGSYASVGAPSMSSASGGVLNGIAASEGNFQGQMDYLSGILGLIGGAIGGASSAFKNLALLGASDMGSGLGWGLMKEMGKMILELSNNKPPIYIKEGGLIDTIRDGFKKYASIQPWNQKNN